jgi:DNA-binding response OmpR family regulator
MTDDTPATILVAEDDAPTRTFLADELSADGCELVLADTTRDACRLLETKFPDLAILDVGLLDGSGLDVVRRVRAADAAGSRLDPDLPLLVLSGRCDETDRVRAFDAGADDFLAKPTGSLIAPGSSTTLRISIPSPIGARAATASARTWGSTISPP